MTENDLYKKKEQTIDWKTSWKEFEEKYENTAYCIYTILCMLGIIALFTILHFGMQNPWIFAYVFGAIIFIALIVAGYRFKKCLKFKEK